MMTKILLVMCSVFLTASAFGAGSEKEVLAAMNTWKQAMLTRDRAALETLYAPGLIYVHSSGKQENKTEAIEAVVAGKDKYESISLEDMAISLYGDTALVKAKVILRINNGTETNTLLLDVLHVWIKNPVGWQMVARHALRLTPQ
ncbi:MAG TPA: nuclear transport factor 2 family protein [Acidobacteriota bacterium]|nr:nuclear transport factor 2 family protein [Acidobacteriota bacterium]